MALRIEITDLRTQIKKNAVNIDILKGLGVRAKNMILERTQRGEFLSGSTGGSRYSSKPTVIPLSAFKGRAWARVMKNNEYKKFMSKQMKLWVILPGGYEEFRKLHGRPIDNVTLRWSGAMLRSLDLTKISINDQTGMVMIGFNRPEADRIAGYHNTDGAGKARVIRKFMGLTDDESRIILAEYEREIKRILG